MRLPLAVPSHLALALALAVGAASSRAEAQPTPPGADAATATYGELLARYVTPGGVRYAAWRGNAADVAALGQVVAGLSAQDPGPLAAPERHALYINLYNAKVLSLVLEGNPAKSIKDLSKGLNPYEIFKRKQLRFAGADLSLEELEARLRTEANDPRVHVAVNCASRSCPPIATEPYRGSTLDTQLTTMATAFLAKPGSVVVAESSGLFGGKTLSVTSSKIFDWYEDDFKATGGAPAFIARYGPADVAARIKAAGEGVSMDFQDYDWNLNSAP